MAKERRRFLGLASRAGGREFFGAREEVLFGEGVSGVSGKRGWRREAEEGAEEDPEASQSSESSKFFPKGVMASLNVCGEIKGSAGVSIVTSEGNAETSASENVVALTGGNVRGQRSRISVVRCCRLNIVDRRRNQTRYKDGGPHIGSGRRSRRIRNEGHRGILGIKRRGQRHEIRALNMRILGFYVVTWVDFQAQGESTSMRSESKKSADGFQAGDSTLTLVDATGALQAGSETGFNLLNTHFSRLLMAGQANRLGGQKERTTRYYGVFAYTWSTKIFSN
ncbi:hypothetical protein B0H13DRAFT_1871139 [Mycena leptocephala]|nr:hypothetical protein B0H13DRAFT_1871139 [Mycena leptocephala]